MQDTFIKHFHKNGGIHKASYLSPPKWHYKLTKSFYLRANHKAAESNQGIKRAPKL